MNSYLILFFAIIAEIIGTAALKASYGCSKLYPTLTVVAAYGAAFWLMAITLKTLPVSTVYAIWSGLGVLGIALIGVVHFKEFFGIWHLLGTLMIVAGVVLLCLVTEGHA